MKKIISILILLLVFIISNQTLAARLFPGEENQITIVENGEICVPEDKAVWEGQGYQCCDGLTPHLTPGILGQTTCQPTYVAILENIIFNSTTWVILFALLFFGGFFLLRRIFKKKKIN
jgi:hypothetical protein